MGAVPSRTTHVLSSGASFVSAVTATSGLEDGVLGLGEEEEEVVEEDADDAEPGSAAHSLEVVRNQETDGEHSNSTAPRNVLLGNHHRPNPAVSESILLNPIP